VSAIEREPAPPEPDGGAPVVSPEEARDRAWLRDVYRGDEPQLTLRAALFGLIVGAVLSASNLYVGLKIGWSFGMGVTASVLAFATFTGLRALRPRMRPLGALENVAIQTSVSAAAYMSTAGLVSSIPALAMLKRDGVQGVAELDGARMVAWLVVISVLGCVIAIPLKRTLINDEQLRFPHGIVGAETVRTLHGTQDEAERSTAMGQARALAIAGSLAALWKLLVDAKIWVFRRVPELLAPPLSIGGHSAKAWSLGWNTSVLLYAAGAIIGPRVGASLLLGALINYGLIGPWLLRDGTLALAPAPIAQDRAQLSAFSRAAESVHAIPVATEDALHAVLRAKWSVWPGTAVMVSASLVALALKWRTVARAFAGLSALVRGRKSADPLAAVEVPTSWFAIGLVACTIASVWMQAAWFHVPPLEGAISVLAAFALAIVASRAAGETGVTPVSAMGKITQLLFGALVPGDVSANLMTATVTAGAASHSADLLTEVKSGYLLGASPRKQFLAQLIGVVAGAAVCVPIYAWIARPEKLGNELPAPSAVAWASVAKLLKDGVGNLPRHALAAAAIAVVVGAVLAVLEERLPARLRAWVPNATAMGIAMVIDANDSLAMATGAGLAWLYAQRVPEALRATRGQTLLAAASGAIAGEGVMGIVVIVLRDVAHWIR
jgi:OPT family oligopeptide transporter